jgi:hypothetical protein
MTTDTQATTETPARRHYTFTQLMYTARGCGIKLRQLQAIIDGDDILCQEEDQWFNIDGWGDLLTGIYHVMRLIADTPNGHLNAEAVEIFRLQIDAALAHLDDPRAKELLNVPPVPPDCSEIPY